MSDNEHSRSAPAIDERDLMAFADGRMDPESPRAAELRAYLAAHPEDAARVAAWQLQNAAIRQNYAPVLAESVPAHLQPAALRARRAERRSGPRRMAIAASLAVMAVTAAVGVSLAPQQASDPELARFASEVSRLPVDAGAQDASLQPASTAAAVDTSPLPSLDLAGFMLTEQRRVRAGEHTATEARYEDQRGQSLRLFVSEQAEAGGPELHRLQHEGREIVYWREDGRMYALSAEAVDSQRLQQIATATMRNELQRQKAQEPSVAGAPAQLQEAPVVSVDTHGASSAQEWSAPAEPTPGGVLHEGMLDDSL